MTKKEYYCIGCDEKMPCIAANLASDVRVCLKEDKEEIKGKKEDM